ncbi:MAG: metal-dependent transcriptional regulator [Thermomicrobiales bacterium]|nr:metal-dependent transcriptional regulator [Thermomicrobiales bacterium]
MEDYLKAIYAMQARGGEATTQRLAEELNISGPSVTNMAKRLHELGLIEHEPYRGMRLTPAGARVALEVVRHHRLLELYLTETLGFGWDEVHAEAERLEHHISDELAARIDRALGYPTHDPHGDPIPSADGMIAAVSPALLSDVGAGERVAVTRVSDRDPDKLRFLGEMGVRPGAEIAVVERFPFDGPLRIRIGGAEHLIGPGVAAMVNVAPPEEPETSE